MTLIPALFFSIHAVHRLKRRRTTPTLMAYLCSAAVAKHPPLASSDHSGQKAGTCTPPPPTAPRNFTLFSPRTLNWSKPRCVLESACERPTVAPLLVNLLPSGLPLRARPRSSPGSSPAIGAYLAVSVSLFRAPLGGTSSSRLLRRPFNFFLDQVTAVLAVLLHLFGRSVASTFSRIGSDM